MDREVFSDNGIDFSKNMRKYFDRVIVDGGKVNFLLCDDIPVLTGNWLCQNSKVGTSRSIAFPWLASDPVLLEAHLCQYARALPRSDFRGLWIPFLRCFLSQTIVQNIIGGTVGPHA